MPLNIYQKYDLFTSHSSLREHRRWSSEKLSVRDPDFAEDVPILTDNTAWAPNGCYYKLTSCLPEFTRSKADLQAREWHARPNASLRYHQRDIPHLRLVCKRFADIGCYYLLSEAQLFFKSSQFERLRKISEHPIMSNTIDTLFYEADTLTTHGSMQDSSAEW